MSSQLIAVLVVIIFYMILTLSMYLYVYVVHNPEAYLTASEIDEFNNVIINFRKYSNIEDLQDVYKNRNLIIKSTGDQVKFWLWGVHEAHPEYFSAAQAASLSEYRETVQKILRRVQYSPTISHVDCIWAAYFGSDLVKYADMIKTLAIRDDQSDVTMFAIYTYKSIMGVNPITGENISNNNDPEFIFDTILTPRDI